MRWNWPRMAPSRATPTPVVRILHWVTKFTFTGGGRISVFDRSFHAKDQEVHRQALQAHRPGQARPAHAWFSSSAGLEEHEAKAPCESGQAGGRRPCQA